MSKCFWILVDGKILEQSRHILAVVAKPEIFGETEKSIKETFRKYGQDMRSNYEGQAREAILRRVINRNHIRIRKNILKYQQHWSIQLYRLTDERRASISSWAKGLSSGDPYSDVKIHILKDNSKIQTSLNLL